MSDPPRESWDLYFLRAAVHVATRATCDRKHVGAVLVRDRVVLATGYNGALPKLPHCDDVGHDMVNGSCVRTSHAEMNAIALAAKVGVRLEGATAYVTAHPCWPCFRLLAMAGVRRVVFGEPYRTPEDPRIVDAANRLGIEMDFLEVPRGQ